MGIQPRVREDAFRKERPCLADTESGRPHLGGVARKIDGTNYRIGGNTNGDDETPTMTGSVAAVDRGMGLHIGPIGPDEDCQIWVRLSAETGGDCALPYIVYYRGPAPTITEVAAA